MKAVPIADLRIAATRMQADFEALSTFGATAQGGVHRPALSEAHLAARAWFRQAAEAAGLQTRVDGAGNHSAILRCGPAHGRTLLLGSHLDSVPDGGRFDGALGVLAALEVLRTVQAAGLQLPYHLEAIDFTDEEGTLCSYLGCFAFAGRLAMSDLLAPLGEPAAFEAGLRRAGLTREGILAAARDPHSLAGYIELHIEQGRRLEQAGAHIGVVTAIPGIALHRLTYVGRADHAGAVPPDERKDAALGASAFILSVREVVRDFPECFANVGQASFEPGAYNIVPARATISLEHRSPDPEQFARLGQALLARARQEAARYGLELEETPTGQHGPALMDPFARQAIQQAAVALGLRWMALPSRAGHDAQVIAGLCPTGMIFVPSVEGASHSPKEFTRWEDCVNGANVLLQTAIKFTGGQTRAFDHQ